MSTYALHNQVSLQGMKALERGIFGLNFVSRYDWEFAEGAEGHEQTELLALLHSLGPANLRYPGGSISEDVFQDYCFCTEGWDLRYITDADGNVIHLTPLTDFFQVAALTNSPVSLVLPTRTGFTVSTAEALLNGTYGQRSELRPEFLQRVITYLTDAVALSEEYGVPIHALKFGNEFWGSGQMTAHEYARFVSTVVAFLDEQEKAGLIPYFHKFVQITSSTGAFSPKDPNTILIKQRLDGSYLLKELEDVPDYDPTSGEWIETVIDLDLGNARTQTTAIATILRENGVADLIYGVSHHNYTASGFDGVDGSSDFGLHTLFDIFETAIGQTGYVRAITEWGPRNTNATGLQYAQMTVESFFELARNGVDEANFWPLTFGNTLNDDRVLIDTSEADLTFGGVAFQWLREATHGLHPLLDYETPDAIDLHLFGNNNRLTIFAGERSGTPQIHSDASPITLDLAGFSPTGSYFLLSTGLGETGNTGTDVDANPVITYENGFVTSGSEVALYLAAWGLQLLELTRVTDGADTIAGRAGNDSIIGDDGDDLLTGNDGADSLKGQTGNDTLDGGAGADIAKGGWGRDKLAGGTGGDTLYGQAQSDVIRGNRGNDEIEGGLGHDILFGGKHRDVILGQEHNDFADGGPGHDTLNGGEGNDTLLGNKGADSLIGDSGDDFIFGGGKADTIDAGPGNDTVNGNFGRDVISLGDDDDYCADGNQRGFYGSDTVDGGAGNDTLISRGGEDVFTGGTGADLFIFRAQSETVTILDFDTGVMGDRLDVSAFDEITDFTDLMASHVTHIGETVEIALDADSRLILSAITFEDLIAEHFIF